MTEIKLLYGDCLELMQGIEKHSIDAIITDPPYGTTACKWDSVIPFNLMWEQLNRIIKPNGAIVLFGSEPFSSALRMSNINNYKYDWIWYKNQRTGFLSAKFQPMKSYETISIFYKESGSYYPIKVKREKAKSGNKFNYPTEIYGGKKHLRTLQDDKVNPHNVIDFIKTLHGSDKRLHPTQKPVQLMEYLIKTYTKENQTVLDFTMGSATTGVACINTNRNFIGIEKEEKYYKIAQERIDKAQKELKLF
jgi:DNA modification methylase